MTDMLKYLLFFFVSAYSASLSAQPSPTVPLIRKVFHDNIDKNQKEIDLLDKKQDKSLNIGNDEEVNLQVGYTLYNKIDGMQDNIESDKTLDANQKIRFLRGLNDVLSSFVAGFKTKELKSDQFATLINAFQDAMSLELKQSAITPIVRDLEPELGSILLKA